MTTNIMKSIHPKFHLNEKSDGSIEPIFESSYFMIEDDFIPSLYKTLKCAIYESTTSRITYKMDGLSDSVYKIINELWAKQSYACLDKTYYTGWKTFDRNGQQSCLYAMEIENCDGGIPIFINLYIDKNSNVDAFVDHELLVSKKKIVIYLNIQWKLDNAIRMFNKVSEQRIFIGNIIEHEMNHAMGVIEGRSNDAITIDREVIKFNIPDKDKKLLEDILYNISEHEQNAHIQGVIGTLNQIYTNKRNDHNANQMLKHALDYAKLRGRDYLTASDIIIAYFCRREIRIAANIDPFYDMLREVLTDNTNDLYIFILSYYMHKYEMINYDVVKTSKNGFIVPNAVYQKCVSSTERISEMINNKNYFASDNDEKLLSCNLRNEIFCNFKRYVEDVYATIVEYVCENLIDNVNVSKMKADMLKDGIDYDNVDIRQIIRLNHQEVLESFMSHIGKHLIESMSTERFVID